MTTNERDLNEELPRLAIYLAERGLHAADAAVLMAMAAGHTAAANSTTEELPESVEKLAAVLRHCARVEVQAH